MMERYPISAYAEGIFDGPHATPKETDEGPVFLGVTNVTEDGRLDLSDVKHISEEDFPRWTKRVLPQKDDIVFSYEATLHRYVLIPEGFRGCLGRRMGLVRPDKSKVEPRYLHYYFLSKEWRAVIESNIISGATVDRIPLKKFPEFPVRLPDLSTQRRIATILSTYDDLIENNRKRIKLLERAARLLYTEWFVRMRFPGHEGVKVKDGVPEGWEKLPSDQVMDIGSGGTPRTHKPEYWDGDVPFFTPKDVTDCIYAYETERTVTEEGVANCNTKIYPKDTVYITARGTVGNLCMGQRPMALNQSCFALQAKAPLSQYYLLFAMKHAVPQFLNQSSGSVFDAIVRVAFTRVSVLVPKEEIVDRFTELVSPMIKQVDVLSTQNRALTRARDLLLPRLMSGKVKV